MKTDVSKTEDAPEIRPTFIRMSPLPGAAPVAQSWTWHPTNGGAYGIPPEITPPLGNTSASTFTSGPFPMTSGGA